VVENGNVLVEDAPKEIFSPMDTNSLPRSQAKVCLMNLSFDALSLKDNFFDFFLSFRINVKLP